MSESGDSTPGSRALLTMDTLTKDIGLFKVPKAPAKKNKRKVLDEDTYIEEMGKIIERDFFPDLERLKAQNEYLDAVEKNDIVRVKEIYAKYSGERPPTERLASPATFETPANIHNSSETIEAEKEKSPDLQEPETSASEQKENETPINNKLSLDGYLSQYTSEDNQSFEEIMTEIEKKHRVKYAYLYNEESKSEEERNKMLALPSIDEQCQEQKKALNLDTWGYKNKNYIMYVPDGVELTREEQIEMSKKQKEVIYSNTRLVVNPFDEQQSKETISELAKSQAKILDGRIGVDGKELVQAETPRIRGFSLVRTPSPCPGVAESPLMTWGQIEGTPFRLDGSDTPIVRSQGPSFKIAEPPKREQIAFALAEKAGERHRDRKQKAIEAARRQLATPSPRASTSNLQRLATMSPAARRLATSQIGRSALRDSYSPSAASTPGSSSLQKLVNISPIVRRSTTPQTIGTPKLVGPNTPVTPRTQRLLTDNLLKLNVPKRKKASEFF